MKHLPDGDQFMWVLVFSGPGLLINLWAFLFLLTVWYLIAWLGNYLGV